MAINVFVPEAVAIAQARTNYTGMFITKPWLAFVEQVADLLRRISATGTRGGIVVTDDEGVAQVITGELDTIEYAAGNFVPDTGTWDVEEADQVTFAWALLGRRLFVAFTLEQTTVAGSPLMLSLPIPDGRIAAKKIRTLCEVVDNGVFAVGKVTVEHGGTTIDIQRLDEAAFATATDTTAVRGTIEFEVDP